LKVSPRRAVPRRATVRRPRTKPVMREKIVPIAITVDERISATSGWF